MRGMNLAEREALVAHLAVGRVSQWYRIDPITNTEITTEILLRAVRNIYMQTEQEPCYLYWPGLQQESQHDDDGLRLYETLKTLPRLTLFLDDKIEDDETDPAIPEHLKQRLRHIQADANTQTYQLDWPSQAQITQAWRAVSDQFKQHQIEPLTELETKRLTALYRLHPTEISKIAAQAAQELPHKKQTMLAYLQQVAQQHNAGIDQELAKSTQANYRLDDMVLAGDTKQQLQELIDRVHYSDELKQLVPHYLPGAQALFWGKPGTGKTMAAKAIAGELQLPIYQINLANIASKWIGETEKHLAKLFDTAQQQHAILHFDEADAIFAKRSEIESSHDKNANMGVSFLLQRMETYTGLLLLSTNFKSNLDDAFLRRFHSTIEFSMPDAELRKKLWKKVWPDAIIQQPSEVSLALLAETFEFSPSQIRNIAERSLLFALKDNSKKIEQKQLKPAIARELEKEGAGFLAEQKINQYFEQINLSET